MTHLPPLPTLNHAYPWGRSFDEYRRMFNLTDADLAKRILGCADGPAAFNAAMRRQNRHAVSCDPLYDFSADQIRQRIDATFNEILALATRERHRFVWDAIPSPEDLGRVRMQAMDEFLADYPAGRAEGRYLAASLPALPFPDHAFDLALCSHFLFLYSDEQPLDFHLRSVLELTRVAGEVRIFPLLDMKGRPSAHVAPILSELPRRGLRGTIDRVPYEFQRGGNEMLVIQNRVPFMAPERPLVP